MLDHKKSVLDAYFAFAFRKTRMGLIVRIAKMFLEGGRTRMATWSAIRGELSASVLQSLRPPDSDVGQFM
jgi:hypothetical protein